MESWSKLNIPTFKYSDICCNSEGDVFYASTLDGTILKNTNIILNIPNAKYVSICCSKDGKYIHTIDSYSNTVYSSNDYGKTFNTLDLILDKISKITCCYTSKTVIIVTQIKEPNYKIRVYSSIDYGKTFYTIEEYLGVPNQIYTNGDASIIYLASINKISKSLDFGKSWNILATVKASHITCSKTGRIVYYVNGDDKIVYKSVDFGETWDTIEINSVNRVKYINCCENGCKVFIANNYSECYINSGFDFTFNKFLLPFGNGIGNPTFITSIYSNSNGSTAYITNEAGEIYCYI